MRIEEEPQPQEPVVKEVFSRIVLDPSFTFSDDEEPALPKTRAKRQSTHNEKRNSEEQRNISSDLPNPPVSSQDQDQEVEAEVMEWAADQEVLASKTAPDRHEPATQPESMELAPVDEGRKAATPEPAPEINEPRVEADDVTNIEPTPQKDVSELIATGPIEITEQYSPRIGY